MDPLWIPGSKMWHTMSRSLNFTISPKTTNTGVRVLYPTVFKSLLFNSSFSRFYIQSFIPPHVCQQTNNEFYLHPRFAIQYLGCCIEFGRSHPSLHLTAVFNICETTSSHCLICLPAVITHKIAASRHQRRTLHRQQTEPNRVVENTPTTELYIPPLKPARYLSIRLIFPRKQ